MSSREMRETVKEEEADGDATIGGAMGNDDQAVGGDICDDISGQSSIEDPNLAPLSEGQAKDFGYPIGCRVSYNFRATSNDTELDFCNGVIESVLMDTGTRKLVFKVERRNNNHGDLDPEVSVETIHEDNIALGHNCPVRVKRNEKEMDGKIFCAKPIFSEDGKMMGIANYTVIIFLKGNQRRVVENVPGKSLRYRGFDRDVSDLSTLNGHISDAFDNQSSDPRASQAKNVNLDEKEEKEGSEYNISQNPKNKAKKAEHSSGASYSMTSITSNGSEGCSGGFIPWHEMWDNMKSDGWSCIAGDRLIQWYYVHPTCKGMKKSDLLKEKVEGDDYFANEVALKRYAWLSLGWRTDCMALHPESWKGTVMMDRVKKRKRGVASPDRNDNLLTNGEKINGCTSSGFVTANDKSGADGVGRNTSNHSPSCQKKPPNPEVSELDYLLTDCNNSDRLCLMKTSSFVSNAIPGNEMAAYELWPALRFDSYDDFMDQVPLHLLPKVQVEYMAQSAKMGSDTELQYGIVYLLGVGNSKKASLVLLPKNEEHIDLIFDFFQYYFGEMGEGYRGSLQFQRACKLALRCLKTSVKHYDTIRGMSQAAKVVLCIAVSLSQVWGPTEEINVSTLMKYCVQAFHHSIMDEWGLEHVTYIVEVLVDAELFASANGKFNPYDVDATFKVNVELRDVEIALKLRLLEEGGFYRKLVGYAKRECPRTIHRFI